MGGSSKRVKSLQLKLENCDDEIKAKSRTLRLQRRRHIEIVMAIRSVRAAMMGLSNEYLADSTVVESTGSKLGNAVAR